MSRLRFGVFFVGCWLTAPAVHARQSPSPPVVAADPGQGAAALTPAPSAPSAPERQARPGWSGHEPTTGTTQPGTASISIDPDAPAAAPSLGGDAPAAAGHAPSVDANLSPSTSAGAATAEHRDWLAPPRQEAVATAPSSSVSGVVAFIALVGFGAAALWYRNNRRRGLDQRRVIAALKVLGSTPIGPKARAVAVEFSGRVMVLGVTDSSITCLQTFEATEVANHAPDGSPEAKLGPSRPASREGVFRNLLDERLRQPELTAADQLAASTVDRTNVATARRPREELVDIEGQAAGLAARLRKLNQP